MKNRFNNNDHWINVTVSIFNTVLLLKNFVERRIDVAYLVEISKWYSICFICLFFTGHANQKQCTNMYTIIHMYIISFVSWIYFLRTTHQVAVVQFTQINYFKIIAKLHITRQLHKPK